MSQIKPRVTQVAILGAGVMGAQIAAHFANARINTLLFDLAPQDSPESGEDKNRIVKQALAHLQKLKPAPFADKLAKSYITPHNYEEDLALLSTCDLVIEVVSENIVIKKSLYERIAPHLGETTILASNTSGISIRALAEDFHEALKRRFCGIHFFNPPRYMPLIELTPTSSTEEKVLEWLETLFVSLLGKGVVYTKDTPNFIANRLGVFSILTTVLHAKTFGLRPDVVDDLTGVKIGRPKSATYRTADLVGLDILSHAQKTMHDLLTDDPWHEYFKPIPWIENLIGQGALGAKSGQGIYKKEGKVILFFDEGSQTYIPADKKAELQVTELLKEKNYTTLFTALRASEEKEAQFLWAIFRDLFHYTLYHAETIAENARDIDEAIRWGFGWRLGPLEIIEAIGIPQVITWLEEEINEGKTLSSAPLPSWVKEITAFHQDSGSLVFVDPTQEQTQSQTQVPLYAPRSHLKIYAKQVFPPLLQGESHEFIGETQFENSVCRIFTLDGIGLIFQNLNKNGAVSHEVLEGINQAIELAEAEYNSLILWTKEAPFSVGADLKAVMPYFMTGDWQAIDELIALFQHTSLNIRHSDIPVVAAVQGYALGGGCEFLLHADRVVASLESYIGLVEVGIGLIPAGGGVKEFALRAARESKGDLLASLKDKYRRVALAQVATSALEAKEMGYLKPDDVVIFNPYELLNVAMSEAYALANANYRSLKEETFMVGGESVAASIESELLNMWVGEFISDYDYYIAKRLAWVMTGGSIETGSMVDSTWILERERQVFLELLQKEKTLERINSMLTTGKPLRN